jgi:hypothetical protein
VRLPSNNLYIGAPIEVFTEERFMSGGVLDVRKIRPFTLTMPDNNYWALGPNLGKAWKIGKSLNPGT